MGPPVFHGRILGGAPRPRLLVQVGAVAVILVVILLVRPGVPRAPSAGVPAAVPSPSTVERSSSPTDEGGLYSPSAGGTVPAAAQRDASRVAGAFTAAWARPTLAEDAWWRGVSGYAEPGYAQLLRTVDPSNVPASHVVGAPRVVRASSGVVVVDVATDAGTCRVTVADASGRGVWRVSTHTWIPGRPR